MSEKKRILFVDDDKNILYGLKRMLRPMRKTWDVVYADSGAKGLELLNEGLPFNAVVSDMRMPVMDGVEFLSKVMQQHPQVVRFGLSGYSDSKTMLKAANVSHQFLSKPCNPDQLRKMLNRALNLRDKISNPQTQQALLKIGSLPSLPELYEKILAEINSANPSITTIGKLISKDVGMSAKVLQITNSVYMGIRNRVSDPAHAVSLLGLDYIKDIVLMIGAFSSACNDTLPKSFKFNKLWSHSFAVAECAKNIALAEEAEKEVCDDSFTAGLLHAIGLLIMATKMPDAFREVVARTEAEGIEMVEAEKEIIGASHAELGGCLLELWGLSCTISEAVAFHNRPSESLCYSFGPLTVLHAANLFQKQREQRIDQNQFCNSLDINYLSKLGLQDRLPQWQETCNNTKIED